jgi:hypothetical protein
LLPGVCTPPALRGMVYIHRKPEEHTMTAALTKLAIVAIPVAGVGLLLSQAVETLTALASSLAV